MALPMLMGGADCGPSNPLQNLAKGFDQDRGVQQDHFKASRAGPSRDIFRTQAASQGRDQDAAKFFSPNKTPGPQLFGHAPFDLSALHRSLPAVHAQASLQQPDSALAAWASDFLQQQQQQGQNTAPQVVASQIESHQERERNIDIQMAGVAGLPQGPMNWGLSPSGTFRTNPIPTYAPQMPLQLQGPVIQPDQAVWDKEFESVIRPLDSQLDIGPQKSDICQQAHTELQTQQDGNELARTAGLLMESVRDSQNPKFQKSQFMGLMKQLRDREVVVDGDKMIQNTKGASGSVEWAHDFQTDVKGKGRSIDSPMIRPPLASADNLDSRRAFRSFTRGFSQSRVDERSLDANGITEETHLQHEENPNDAYFRQDNEEYIQYWNAHRAEQHAAASTSQSADWDRMQQQWELFEANATGIKPVNDYQFQTNNPYLLGDRSRNRQHMTHLGRQELFNESVLELEAAVQRDPKNASVWFELGVKQQENEREHKAIQALQRAVDLDPMHLPSWIALAVSYTNDSNRIGTFDAINKWVERNDKYRDAVQQFRANFRDNSAASQMERFNGLIQCLISVARSDTSGEIDADIQVALAVLLNTNEDYERSMDCFLTALAVRPDDWLLYNRVGATMANSGRADEALQYYYRALELNPAYIRARFNLGISCINLRRYEEAAQHVLDALVLQDSDSVRDSSGLDDNRGITSSILWESLKTTCLHMRKIELAAFCDRRDLDGFRIAFQTAGDEMVY